MSLKAGSNTSWVGWENCWFKASESWPAWKLDWPGGEPCRLPERKELPGAGESKKLEVEAS